MSSMPRLLGRREEVARNRQVFGPRALSQFGGLGSPARLAGKSIVRAKPTRRIWKPMALRADGTAEGDGRGAPPWTGPTVKVHWCSQERPYEGWGLHVWGAAKRATSWEEPMQPCGADGFGVFWEVDVTTWTIGQDREALGVLVHKGEDKDVEAVVPKSSLVPLFDPSGSSQLEVWLVSGRSQVFYNAPDLMALPVGDLGKARAHWLSRDVLAWRADTDGSRFMLHCCPSASLKNSKGQLRGGDEACQIELTVDPHGLPPDLLHKFPFLRGAACLRLPEGSDVAAMVRCQVAASKLSSHSDRMLDCTGVQLHGVLDDLFAYDGPLGCKIDGDLVSLAVWAPTSTKVELVLYPGLDCQPENHPMDRGSDGVWRIAGPRAWVGLYYVYRLQNFSPWTGVVETSVAPDPYSRAAGANGLSTQIADINASEFLTEGWDRCGREKPPLPHHADACVYELHVRDFSVADQTVPPHLRGKYLAFELDTHGTRHLSALAEAGLTHVHLLPCYDFGTVPECAKDRAEADPGLLASFGPSSPEQQRLVTEKADSDGYNWGYDPVLYGVPEGSYATDEAMHGAPRSLEFRRMVVALNKLGLRVVLDVVYNHLLSSGPGGDKSVYDKVVPGYYLRRSEDGSIENSTCMNNTASEHYMVERLIVDDLVHWAKDYKVDGFRFDLMGHIMLRALNRARREIDGLTLEKDGIDGKMVLMYGEGWEFGEVAGCARGVNGSQRNLGGTGIGSFNDRIREASVGGSPFADPRLQGFATGLLLAPWPAGTPGIDQGDANQQLRRLLADTDKIRIGLAGNLAGYTFEDSNGQFVRGDTAHGGGIGYTKEPKECVNYVSAHDNETLFDMCVLKMPQNIRTTEERIRASWLCSSLVALGNGIPFFHAGDELLRSKSLDRDSYNSGDWFNRLDFTGETHNLGVGLPPANKNREKWPMMEPILRDLSMRPSKDQILASIEKFKEMLRIRKSTSLLGLREAKEIMRRVRFPNCGPRQIPGLILMEVIDEGWSGEGSDLSSRFAELDRMCNVYSRVIVAFNARLETTNCQVENAAALSLHPLQSLSSDGALAGAGVDRETGELRIPPLSAVVFVELR